MKSAWVLQLPVVKYAELTDKDLEDINFNGGVICFRLYISKIIELRYKKPNSTIKVDSIIWKSGYDVLVVKYTQTFEFEYCPLRDQVFDYMAEKNVKFFNFNVIYDSKRNEFGFYITVQCKKNEYDNISGKLIASELKERLIALEPNLACDVHIDYDFNDWISLKKWTRNLRVPFHLTSSRISDILLTLNKVKTLHNKNCNL